MSGKKEHWTVTMRKDQERHHQDAAMGFWRAGLGDPHPDETARAFNIGKTAGDFVRGKVDERDRKRREAIVEAAERQYQQECEEQQRRDEEDLEENDDV